MLVCLLFDAARRDDCACALECHVTMLVPASVLRRDTPTQQISPVACPRTHKQLKCTMWIPPIPPGRSRNPKCARRICDQLLQSTSSTESNCRQKQKVVIVLQLGPRSPAAQCRSQGLSPHFSGKPHRNPGKNGLFLGNLIETQELLL
jgi:hypothetical protein